MGLGVVPLETLEATAMLIVVKAPAEVVLDSKKYHLIIFLWKTLKYSESFFW